MNIKSEKATINNEIAKLANTNNVNEVETAIANILEAVNNMKGYIVVVEDELEALVKVMRNDIKEDLLNDNKELSDLFYLTVAELDCL